MLQLFVNCWKSENKEEDFDSAKVDLIVPISFATLRNRLTAGTAENATKAVRIQQNHYPEAVIAFSSCSYPFPGAEKVEDGIRTAICTVYTDPIIAKPMINTVDEAMNIRDKVFEKGINPKCILIVTGEIHSRSARYVWQKVFPDARIMIACIPHHLEVQPDHLVASQRTMFQWVISNIARQIALRILPLSTVRKIKRKAQT